MSIVIPEHTEGKYEPYPEYRQSGVEWLAEVPIHWDINRLKYSVNLINDKVENGESEKPYLGLKMLSLTGKIIESDFIPEIEGASNSFRKDDVLIRKSKALFAKAFMPIFRHMTSDFGTKFTEILCTISFLLHAPRSIA
jgi:type I restriction enzyme S subunit